MKNQIKVTDLLVGMKNLTFMRESIDELLNGICGRLIKLANEQNLSNNTFVFENDTVHWLLKLEKRVSGREIFIVCGKKNETPPGVMTFLTHNQTVVPMEYVEFVHDNLQVLLDGILEYSPRMHRDAHLVSQLAAKQF